MIKLSYKLWQIIKFVISLVINIFKPKNKDNSFFHSIKDLLQSFKQSDKMSLINKLTGEQHVNVILKKTIESIIKEDIHYKDRKNARKRNILVHKRDKKKKHFMLFLAFFGLSTCLLILGLISNMSSEIICIIATAAGIFGSCLKDIYVFEFGSRKEKNNSHLEE